MAGIAGEVGGVSSRLRCGCVGDENGVGASELSVLLDGDDGCNETGRRTNCPRVFLICEASVIALETGIPVSEI
jgi:hypothetical protein